MDTTLNLTRGELVALLCALNEATTASMHAELHSEDALLRNAARANADIFMRLASRIRSAEQALALRAEHYPPGKVRPPRAWPAPPGQAQGEAA
jgi:hypothetical protein